jgi:hypothetical protein
MNAVSLNIDCSLTDLDWQVVELARLNGPRSMNPDTGFIRSLKDFFGLPLKRRLASDKLEALRRFCVRAWFWDLVRSRDVRLLMQAGYTSADLFQILAHVAGFRGFTPSIEEQPV